MENPSKIAAKLTIGGALALLIASSAFADSSHQNETRRRERDRSQPSAEQSGGHDRSTNRAAEAERAGRTEVRPEVVDRNRDSRSENSARNDARTSADRNRSQSRDSRSENGARNDSYRNGGDRNRSQSGDSRTEARREAARNDGYRNGNQNDSYRNNGGNRGSENRNNNNRGYNNRNNNNRHEYREGSRNAYRGTIRSFARERGGYRIFLGGGPYSYWVPDSYLRGHQLRVGLSIRLGGIFNGGYISVDALGWPGYNDSYYNQPYYDDVYYDDGYRNDGYGNDSYYGGYSDDVVRGRVERVDFRNHTVVIQDDSNRGRYVTVDLRSVDRRNSRLDIADLRPGDRITLTGTWLRGNVFGAAKIEAIDAY
jgi:hypothetical protein